MTSPTLSEGIFPINKPEGITSFQLVRILRKLLGVKKIGHAGTLDPFATGVMVMLVGRNYTRLSDKLLNEDKEYTGTIHLGVTTDTLDKDGVVTATAEYVPSLEEIVEALKQFQGEIEQIPPMYSAKKIQGKKLYELARQGKEVERKAVKVRLSIEMLDYSYPHLKIHVRCTKGTYIRSLADDIGKVLGTGGHLVSLMRTRSGSFDLSQCIEGKELSMVGFDLEELRNKVVLR